MNINKLKAVAYATYLSAGGYKVLRNPKGTPSTVVRAIRYSHSIDPETLDKSETYKRITRDFAQPEKTKIQEFLFRDDFAFYNKETKKVDYQNSMEYSRYTTDKKDVYKIKNQIDFDILDKRNLKDIHKKKYSKKEQIVDLSKAFLGYVSAKTVTIKKSLAEVETEKYYDTFSKKSKNNSQPSFLSTLIHNLKSSCN